MSESMSLPPSVTVWPTVVGVSVTTIDGVTIQVDLPRPRGLTALPREEMVAKAQRLAKAALEHAAASLPGS